MAFYVAIQKTGEDDIYAEYKFGPNAESVGYLRINKGTGEINVLEDAPEDDTCAYSIRASRKLTLHFRNNEFPEVTCFAS